MTKKLLVVTDLGRFKAYRLEENRRFSHPRLELLEDWETNVNQHLSEELSDQAGRFRKGHSDGDARLSDGEPHNIDLERRRRAVKTLAKRISELLNEQHLDSCYLAAGSEINQTLIEELDRPTRAKIERNVPANLTRLSHSEVLDHFSE
jgi:hypothetical protein